MSTVLPPPEVATHTPTKNGMGLAALILGIVAIVFAFIPFLSYIAWAIGIAAVVLGILGARKVGRAKGGAITGIILGAIAILLAVIMSIIYTILFAVATASGVSSAASAASGNDASAASSGSSASAGSGSAAGQSITYSVTGTGKASDITYLSVSGTGDTGQEQVSSAKLPWTKTVNVTSNSLFASSVFSLVAQNSASGSITCSITADGKVISKHTSTGQYSVVSCSGSTGG